MMNESNGMSGGQGAGFRSGWNIRNRLIVYFSVAFVTVLFISEAVDIRGVPGTAYVGRREQAKQDALGALSLIADLKQERLVRLLNERRDDVRAFAVNSLVVEQVELLRGAWARLLAKGLEGGAVWTGLRQERSYALLLDYLKGITRAYGVYPTACICDAATGMHLVSTDEAHVGTDARSSSFFSLAIRSRSSVITNVEMGRHSHTPIMRVAHVIADNGGDDNNPKATAVLVMELGCDDIIKPILQTGVGPEGTGEALLVDQDRRILTSLRYPLKDGTIAKPLEYKNAGEPAVRAARGESGLIAAKDYRGEPVWAAYRHIRVTPEWGWGLVVKRDEAELLAPVRRDMHWSMGISVVSVLAVFGLTVGIARGVAGPIMSLSRTATRVAGGDLSARAPVTTRDEIATLAVTFNEMVERIEHWHRDLEERVAARTAELSRASEELKQEIAERRRTAELLQQVNVELGQKNAEMERFVYTVSHDLKSPLVTIQGFATHMGRDMQAERTDRLPEFAHRIVSAVARMKDLIDNLLELSRVGRARGAPEPIDVGEVVRGIVKGHEEEVADRRIAVEIQAGMPIIMGDRSLVGEVFDNLFVNAVRYGSTAPEPRIVVGVQESESESRFFVRDNGRGIPKEYHDKVFEIFQRLETSEKGSGVGLAIVKRAVEVLGGRVWLESQAGEGAVFWVAFPKRVVQTRPPG